MATAQETSTATTPSQQGYPACDRIAVRLPPFWADDPEIWFAQIENQFLLAGVISEDTKFSYVAGHLDQRYAAEVRDILTNPPASGKYQRLKSELIKRLSESQENKLRRLLEHEDIGDRKPSQFLRHLRTLAGTVVPDDVLRPLWLGRLPASSQAILATQKKTELDDLSNLADAISETTSRTRIAEVQSDPMEALVTKLTTLFTAQIAEVTTTLRAEIAASAAKQERPQHHRFRSRSHSRSHSRSQSRSQSRETPGVCWYHRRFGNDAKKCTTPCTHSGKDQADR